MVDALFTNEGQIPMYRGAPRLEIKKDGKWKMAGLYDEQRPEIPSEQSVEFVYTIGEGWLINEYELQVRYRPREKLEAQYILSPPLSFDVRKDD